ncbi:MAG: hypothetical protein NTY64_11600, partial [Deltaproteobacteria bacterium]|nr:hypothetical protein [Deltaproteobacteria bacterium]
MLVCQGKKQKNPIHFRQNHFPGVTMDLFEARNGPPSGKFKIFFTSVASIQRLGSIIFDGFAKSPFGPLFVIPAKAGIQLMQIVLDSCLRKSDGFSDFLQS